MANLASGVEIASRSIPVVEGRTVTSNLSFTGASRSSGNQITTIGTRRDELVAPYAIGFSGYYSNGAVQLAVARNGELSVRLASSAASIQIFAAASWVLE